MKYKANQAKDAFVDNGSAIKSKLNEGTDNVKDGVEKGKKNFIPHLFH